jgi:hypothetical protein
MNELVSDSSSVEANQLQADALLAEAYQAAKELDLNSRYAKADGETLLVDYEHSRASLTALGVELWPDFWQEFPSQEFLNELPPLAIGCASEIPREALIDAIEALAIAQTTTKEIHTRVKVNGANRNIAYYCIGRLNGDKTMAAAAFDEVLKITLGSIVYTNCFQMVHPDHPHIWRDIVNDLLLWEVTQHSSSRAVLVRLLGKSPDKFKKCNYIAIERDIFDEMKNFNRHRGREVNYKEHFASKVRPDLHAMLLFQGLARAIDAMADRITTDPGIKALLREVALYLFDPEGWEGSHGAFSRPHIKRAAMRRRGISQSQANRDFLKLIALIEVSPELQAIKAHLVYSLEETQPQEATQEAA